MFGDFHNKLVGGPEIPSDTHELLTGKNGNPSHLVENRAHVSHRFHDIAGTSLALRADHRGAFAYPAQRLTQIPAPADKGYLKTVLFDVKLIVGGSKDFALIDKVDSKAFENLSLHEVSDPALGHDRYGDRFLNPRDHLRIAHSCHAAVRTDIRRHSFERHDRLCPRIGGDLRLLCIYDVHNNAALEHFRETDLCSPILTLSIRPHHFVHYPCKLFIPCVFGQWSAFMLQSDIVSIAARGRIAESLEQIRERIDRACLDAGRDREEVRLMVVSKTRSAAQIAAAIAAGARYFGESRIQELTAKWRPRSDGEQGALYRQTGESDSSDDLPAGDMIARREIRLSLIGHLQSNKAKDAAASVDAVSSIDKASTAEALARRLGAHAVASADQSADEKTTDTDHTILDVLLQINTSGEESKFGVAENESDIYSLVDSVLALPQLRLRGLMTIAPFIDEDEAIRRCFRRLRGWYEAIETRYTLDSWDTLSMGMSGDLEIAVQEGSTEVRPGTAIFGPREGP